MHHQLQSTIGFDQEELKGLFKFLIEKFDYVDHEILYLEEMSTGLRGDSLEEIRYNTRSLREHVEMIKEVLNRLGVVEFEKAVNRCDIQSIDDYNKKYIPKVVDNYIQKVSKEGDIL